MKFRLTEPHYSTRHGRTLLTYPELGLRGLDHGTAVFKEPEAAERYDHWLEAATAWVAKVIDTQTLSRSSDLPRPASKERGHGLPAPGMEHSEPVSVIVPRQVHGNVISVVDGTCQSRGTSNLTCDGLVTVSARVAIGVSVADCIPLLAFNEASGVIGVAHCGWRGTAAGIVEELVRSLASLVSDPGETRYVIGAGIGPCCYQVRGDLLSRFPPAEVERFARERDGTTYFDLKQTVGARLVAQGARPDRISIDKTCTACQKFLLSSYRRDGAACGRMLAFMALRD